MLEIMSQAPDFGGLIITVFVIIVIIALVSITLIILAKRTPDLRFAENTVNRYEPRPNFIPSSEVVKPFEPKGFKFCTSCGYKRTLKANFCVKCGYKLKTYWE